MAPETAPVASTAPAPAPGAATASARRRRTRVLVTLALLAGNLVAFNGLIAAWPGARLDLTRDQLFSISPATRKLLQSLDDDLVVVGYFSKRTHPKLAPLVPQIEDLLEEYRALARGRLHVEIVDPGESDRAEKEANDRYGVSSTPFRLASKFETGIVNAYFAVVIKYGDQYVRYGFDDLIEVEPLPDGDVDVRLRNLEYDLTRAMKKVVYGFRGGTALFERVGKPVELTAVMTPDRLPSAFKDVPDALRKAAHDLEEAGKGRFKYEEITPTDAASQTTVARRFGAQPLTLGPFGEQPFYLYGFLSVGGRAEQLPLTGGNVTAASLREAIESSLKRQAPGFLKTVGVVAPEPSLPPEVMMQLRMQGQMPNQPPPEFDQVKNALRQDYTVKDVTLDGGAGVSSDVDVLLVLKPKSLSARAVFNLDQFLMRGGRVILCAEAYDPEFGQGGLNIRPVDSGLDPWLEHLGVRIDKTLLLDDRNQPLPIPQVRQTAFGAMQTWVMRPYPYLVAVRDQGLKNRAVTAKLDAVGIYWGSPIEVENAASKGLQISPILVSSERSWTDDDAGKANRVEYTIPPGTRPHVIAAALQGRFESYFADKPVPPVPGDSMRKDVALKRSPETRLVVVGDAAFVSDLVARALGRQPGGLYTQNLGFVQNLIDWMNLDNDLVSIRTRASEARPIKRMGRSAAITFEALVDAIPLLVLAAIGLARYWRRQHALARVMIAPAPAEPVPAER